MEGDKAAVPVLTNCFVSPFGNRARIALRHKGVEYEEKLENLAAKSPLLLSSNPVHGQGPRPHRRRQARACYVDTKMPECAVRVWRSPTDVAAVEEGKKDMVAALKTLEDELGAKPYFAGNALGYVDVALVPFAPWFLTYERLGGFSVAAKCPALAVWAARCVRENECVAKSLPEPEHVFPVRLRHEEDARPRLEAVCSRASCKCSQ
ncbi:hypothetical protein U9M48_030421 [Paspalum notatum var. saurae]|uniref:Glutathione S-transferase n=1 Tax=Paspalum notatum var. saurae TaxID=547442 RepID=A0AAQ3U4V0_PASNO